MYNISEDGDIKSAVKEGQELVDVTQRAYGVSSRQHIDAIELLAKVRVAQSKYDEAVELLNKSVKWSADFSAKNIHRSRESMAKLTPYENNNLAERSRSGHPPSLARIRRRSIDTALRKSEWA